MHLHRHHIHHLANENSLFHLAERGLAFPATAHIHQARHREKRSSGPNCLTRRLMTTSATGPRKKICLQCPYIEALWLNWSVSLGINVIIIMVVHCVLKSNQICWGDLGVKIRNVRMQTGVYAICGSHGEAVCHQRGRRHAINSQTTPKPLLFSPVFYSSLSGSLPCNRH